MDKWLINGVVGDAVPVDDRGLAYGDGLFETIALRAGQPRWLDAHLQRLSAGCERLNIPVVAVGKLADEVAGLYEGIDYGTLKLIVTRGSGPRGYAPGGASAPLRIAGVAAAEPVPVAPANVRLCETLCSRNSQLAGLKTLNRLEQVLARSEWDDAMIGEGLMFDETGLLVSGTMSNVFVVIDNQLCTPGVTVAGVAGIMRAAVLREAAQTGLNIEVRDIHRDELVHVTEAFLTNALRGIIPVASLDGRSLAPAETTSVARQLLAAAGVTECTN